VRDNRIADNIVINNFGDGISFSVSGSGANTRNLVEGNFLSGNSSRGIAVAAAATNNIIIRNTAIGNSGGNYGLHTNLVSGPIVTAAGSLATTNGAPALSPWANFSR
jgi:parallel beta-helix repeat protein